jgi:regulator of protease activity HflC (stomatin/prohibitin superfamily)
MRIKRPNWIALAVVVGIAALFLLIALSSSYVRIQYGTVGMVTRFGGITNRVMQPGLNWKIPFVDDIVMYRTQELVYATMGEGDTAGPGTYSDAPTDTTTKDGQQITVKYSVRFRIDPMKITQIATEMGDEGAVVEKVVKFHSRILGRNIPKEYEALDLYTGNIQQVQIEFEDQLRPLLEKKGIILEAFGLRKIDFQADYVQAVEQKQIESETITTEQYRAEQAKWKAQGAIEEAKGKAQSSIEEAKGQAEATIENARGNAEKVRVIAIAEAEAIRVKGEILKQYPEIIQLEFVNSLIDPNGRVTWGIMPQGSVLPFLNVTPSPTQP